MSDHTPTGASAFQPMDRSVDAGRRRQAWIGAAAGFVVIAVLVGVFVWVNRSGGDPVSAPVAGASAPAAPVGSGAASPGGPDPALGTKPVVKAGTGPLTRLVVTPIVKGAGPAVTAGQTIAVHYVGVSYTTGEQFDASWDRGQPFQTPIGVGRVIPGWDQGLVGVPVGSRVQLDIPANLAYGDNARGGAPPGPLRFVVDVLGAQ